MKTSSSIRTLAVSLFALAAITFASKTFATSFTYLKIEFENGTVITVDVNKDGSFKTPPLKAGRVKVQFFWDRSGAKSATLNVSATPGGSARGISSPIGAVGDRESSAPSVSEIAFSYEILTPRDPQSGQSTGRRMHKPANFKVSDSERLLPTVNKKLGSITLDEDCDGITGKIEMKDQNGKTMAADDWTK